MDIDVKSVSNVDPIPLQPVTINPLTIADVQKIAPAAVHIKELNQIAPLLVESLRVDHVRNVDPLRIDQFKVTHLPTVNISLSRMPSLDLSIRRMPPLGIALQQMFDIPSRYTVRTRLLGFEILRFELDGRSRLLPRDCARREQSRTHERSFPDVAIAGNPAIPSRVIDKCVKSVTHAIAAQQPPAHPPLNTRPYGAPLYMQPHNAPLNRQAPRATLNVGAPRFNYSVDPKPQHSSAGSSIRTGG